jgi:hypothetical protein
MKKKRRKLLPSPAMIVAIVALIVALVGTAFASGVLTKKKVNKIITNRAPGLSVANADKLGGVAASGYQGSCKAGAIKAAVRITTIGLSMGGPFQNTPGFNCFQPGNTTSSVRVVKNGPMGAYAVWFVGNEGPDALVSTVCSADGAGITAACFPVAGSAFTSGETIFQVDLTDAAGNLSDVAAGFSLVAF